MLRLGNSLEDVLFSYAWDGVTYTVVSRTLLGALYAGLWPLGLIKIASVLDNPFSVALARADKAGKVLAHALIDSVQGKRPVTLMGYSIGARVIYACLVELAEQHAFGLVESAILMGTPASSDTKSWRQLRSVVAGRVVNVYSIEDYVLGFLYRSTKLQFGVAGLQEVNGVNGVENFNASKLITGHDRYRFVVGKILLEVGMGDVNDVKVVEQERAWEVAERKRTQFKKQAKEVKVVEKESANATEPTIGKPISNPHGCSQTLIDVVDEQKRFHRAQSPPTHTVRATKQISIIQPTEKTTSIASQNNLSDYCCPPKSTEEKVVQNVHMPEYTTMKSTGNAIKTAPIVAVTEVPIASSDGRKEDDESDGEYCTFDNASDVNSDFGELSMVEPVAMDDNDYGLM